MAFSIVYFIVAQGISERSDAWLSGEAQVLAHVSADAPRDRLYNRIVGEVAELAIRELPDERNARGQRLNSVFFLERFPITMRARCGWDRVPMMLFWEQSSEPHLFRAFRRP